MRAPTVNDIARTYAPAYLARYGDTLPAGHRKVIEPIIACRTPEQGTTIYRCQDCGQHHRLPCSCGNRHCPLCQHAKSQHWLSRLYRGKFRDAMRKAGLLEHIPPEVWSTQWNVHCQPVASAEAALCYLAPYIFGVAISNARIVALDDDHVALRYRTPGSARTRILRLPALELLRRLLHHVLPTGFMKVRYFGVLSPSSANSGAPPPPHLAPDLPSPDRRVAGGHRSYSLTPFALRGSSPGFVNSGLNRRFASPQSLLVAPNVTGHDFTLWQCASGTRQSCAGWRPG